MKLPKSTLEKIKHFVPNNRIDETFYRKNENALTIACIISKGLYSNIKHDANLVLVTEENYQTVLKYSDVDFILVDDCVHSVIGELWGFQDENSESSIRLQSLLSIATKVSIPKVLWLTNSDSKRYPKSILELFDMVYTTADHDNQGNNSYPILTWPIQPRLHTPISVKPYECDGKVWIDGIYEAETLLAELGREVFRKYKFSILESIFFPFTSSLSDEISEFFKGVASEKDRISGVRHALAYISCAHPKTSCKKKITRDLEIIAAGVPVLYYGNLSTYDPRKGLVYEFECITDLVKELVRLRDDIYRLRKGLLPCKTLHLKHTVNHKLSRIAKDLSIEYQWNEFPSVSLLCGTIRKNNISILLDTFKKLNYPNKELVIIYNGCDLICKEEVDRIINIDNVGIYFVEPDECLGGALNLGISKATGEYVFKLDDDDTYSENYIQDMMLFTRDLNVDIFGKPHVTFFNFEGRDNLCLRSSARSFNYCGNVSDPRFNGKQLLVGNSISGRTKIFRKYLYISSMPKHTDTGLFDKLKDKNIKFAVVDPFNMIVNRRSDLSSHTWSIDMERDVSRMKCSYTKQDAIL